MNTNDTSELAGCIREWSAKTCATSYITESGAQALATHLTTLGWRKVDVESNREINGMTVIKAYDELLKKHPFYKKFIEHTPFENDAACIAWDAIRPMLKPPPSLQPTIELLEWMGRNFNFEETGINGRIKSCLATLKSTQQGGEK